MIRLAPPSDQTIREFIAAQSSQTFAYNEVGESANQPPSDYTVDRNRVVLGTGIEVFEAAKIALTQWKQFDLPWVQAMPADTPIEPGETVAIVGKAVGCYWMNACRIIYVISDDAETKRFGFAYGTLPQHMAVGEERFLVEMDPSGEVTFEILAFSRPKRLFAKLTYFHLRTLQKRFGKESPARFREEVKALLEVHSTQAA